jgi:hypothetical protein
MCKLCGKAGAETRNYTTAPKIAQFLGTKRRLSRAKTWQNTENENRFLTATLHD